MHADKNRIIFKFVIPAQAGIQARFNLAHIASALCTHLVWILASARMTIPESGFEFIGVHLRLSAVKIVFTVKT
jgi:hypothetical protein